MLGKQNHPKQHCTKCGDKRPRFTPDKKASPKGSRAQERRRYCRACAHGCLQ